MPYVSFWKEKSHSVTFPVCAYMLHDNLAKFLWNLELKTKLLLHGYKYEENKFCHVLLFKKIVAEWEEFFRKMLLDKLYKCSCRPDKNQARSNSQFSKSWDQCSSSTFYFFFNGMQSRLLFMFCFIEYTSLFLWMSSKEYRWIFIQNSQWISV